MSFDDFQKKKSIRLWPLIVRQVLIMVALVMIAVCRPIPCPEFVKMLLFIVIRITIAVVVVVIVSFLFVRRFHV